MKVNFYTFGHYCFTISELDVTKTKDGSVCKRVLKKGSGVHNPVAGAEATISFYRQSAPDDVTEITYCVGDPGSKVPYGLDLALRHMNVEEHSQITISKDDNIGATKENPIIFELILKSFEKVTWFKRLIVRLTIYQLYHHFLNKWFMRNH